MKVSRINHQTELKEVFKRAIQQLLLHFDKIAKD